MSAVVFDDHGLRLNQRGKVQRGQRIHNLVALRNNNQHLRFYTLRRFFNRAVKPFKNIGSSWPGAEKQSHQL